MLYRIEESETGRYNAIVENPSFGWKSVYVFARECDAQQFLNTKKLESEERLAGIPTISEYFNIK